MGDPKASRPQSIPYHVTQRGNNRDAFYFTQEDYRFYRDCIKQSTDKYEAVVHAYVLM
jgi:putative transposase